MQQTTIETESLECKISLLTRICQCQTLIGNWKVVCVSYQDILSLSDKRGRKLLNWITKQKKYLNYNLRAKQKCFYSSTSGLLLYYYNSSVAHVLSIWLIHEKVFRNTLVLELDFWGYDVWYLHYLMTFQVCFRQLSKLIFKKIFKRYLNDVLVGFIHSQRP